MAAVDDGMLALLQGALTELDQGFVDLPAASRAHDRDGMARVLGEAARRLHENYPYHHPMYAGQMLKPPHPVARLAYALAMHLNPNNHALDGGIASSKMEREAVAGIASMFGLHEHLGHLTGGGTMANLEALWVASRLRPGGYVLASAQSHYTHARLCEVLGIPFVAVATDATGRMDMAHLRELVATHEVAAIVATLGTTGCGAVDPLADIAEAAPGVRIHVDAAYGGYFGLTAGLDPETRRHFDAIAAADSIAIDPHKHGLQPYGCGCILFSDPSVGRLYQHDSPYTYFSSDELHLGEISLECSRPGAAAVALWATMQLLPLVGGGRFAEDLDRSLLAARTLHARLDEDEDFVTLMRPELDIVLFAPRGSRFSEVSEASARCFAQAGQAGLHLALMELPSELVTGDWYRDRDSLRCLRSCLMKPEHLDWVERIHLGLKASLA